MKLRTCLLAVTATLLLLASVPVEAGERPSRADLLTGSTQPKQDDDAESKPAAADAKRSGAAESQGQGGKRPQVCRDDQGRRVKC